MKTRGRRAGRLWLEAARAVTGRGVEVRWAVPELVNPNGEVADGEALIFDGKPLIRIRPGLDPERKWKVFCHELAHVCCGHVDVLEDMPVDFGPASLRRGPGDYSDDFGFQEVQAEHFRRVEIEWPVLQTLESAPASLPARLRALASCYCGGGALS